jgi:hypothetical protein
MYLTKLISLLAQKRLIRTGTGRPHQQVQYLTFLLKAIHIYPIVLAVNNLLVVTTQLRRLPTKCQKKWCLFKNNINLFYLKSLPEMD